MSSLYVKVVCPYCGNTFVSKSDHARTSFHCEQCDHDIDVDDDPAVDE